MIITDSELSLGISSYIVLCASAGSATFSTEERRYVLHIHQSLQ